MLYLSTSSPDELSAHNSEYVRFRAADRETDPKLSVLENEHGWFVGSKAGCSCTFRHLAGGDLGFDEPEDWLPEDEDAIKATAELYRVIAALVHAGNRVDCVDTWMGEKPAEISRVEVSLNDVPERTFRFFESHHFVFMP